MQCVNCKNEINVGGNICPYCHTQPFVYGSAPYSGASGTNTESIDLSALWFGSLIKWWNTPSIKENETTYIPYTDCIGRKWGNAPSVALRTSLAIKHALMAPTVAIGRLFVKLIETPVIDVTNNRGIKPCNASTVKMKST